MVWTTRRCFSISFTIWTFHLKWKSFPIPLPCSAVVTIFAPSKLFAEIVRSCSSSSCHMRLSLTNYACVFSALTRCALQCESFTWEPRFVSVRLSASMQMSETGIWQSLIVATINLMFPHVCIWNWIFVLVLLSWAEDFDSVRILCIRAVEEVRLFCSDAVW